MLDGREVAASAYRIEPDEEAEVPIAWRPPAQGSLAVTVDDPQGLAADNVRYVALDVHGPAKALVVTGGGQSGIYLARALETDRRRKRGVRRQNGEWVRVVVHVARPGSRAFDAGAAVHARAGS